MSKFFGAVSSSDSDSSDSESSEDVENNREETKKAPQPKQAYYGSDSDSSDDERKVLDPKTKMKIALKKNTSAIRRCLADKDFVTLHTEFTELQKELSKQSDQLSEHGDPNFFLKTLMDMEDLINGVKNSEEKSMSKSNKKNFGTLKNKFKKFIKASYEDKLEKYRQDPQVSEAGDDDEDEDDSDSDSDSDEEEQVSTKKSKKKTKKDDSSSSEGEDSDSDSSSSEDEKPKTKSKSKPAKDEDSGEDSDFTMGSESDGDSSSDSSEDEDEEKAVEEEKADKPLTLEERRKRWLKKPEDMQKTKKDKSKKKEDKKKDDENKTDAEKEVKLTVLAKEKWLKADFTKNSEVEDYLQKAKKPTVENSAEFLESEPIFVKMYNEVSDDRLLSTALHHLISGNFASIKNNVDIYMKRDKWILIVKYINRVIDLLEQSKNLTEKHKKKISPFKFFEALSGQLYLAFQRLQPQNIEYVKRLRDEHTLLNLGERIIQYYTKIGNEENVAKISLIILSHLYYKHDQIYHKMTELIKNKPEAEQNTYYVLKEGESESKISSLVKVILYNSPSRTACLQAVLYQIYHHAIHNRFHQAKDQMENIQSSNVMKRQDANTQILFNRTIVQIAMSAFRIGLFEECYKISEPIANYGRIKELLGQIIRYNNTERQILNEKKRFVPAHLQIDSELVDFINMVCAMLMEIPNISKAEFTSKYTDISMLYSKDSSQTDMNKASMKSYWKLMGNYDSKLFNGPPEQPRDHVVYASRALFNGDWRQALEHLLSAKKMWKQIPEFDKANSIKDILTNKIKEIGFNVLVYRSSRFYESYSINDLGDLFELSQSSVKKLVCKLIVQDGYKATINNKENIVVIREVESSRAQILTKAVQDKLNVMYEHTRKMHDFLKDNRAGKTKRKKMRS